MNVFLAIAIVVVFVYTIGFARVLWKEKNKIGSIAVSILACVALVLPYFTYFRN